MRVVFLALPACAWPWVLADDSGCLQSYTNYPALWATSKATGIDTGRPSASVESSFCGWL